jgi:hypothetical protein
MSAAEAPAPTGMSSMLEAVKEKPVKDLVSKCMLTVAGLSNADPSKYEGYYNNLIQYDFLGLVERVIKLYVDRDADALIMSSLETLAGVQSLHKDCRQAVFDKCGNMILHILQSKKNKPSICMHIFGTLRKLFEDSEIKVKCAGGRAIPSIVAVMEANSKNRECVGAAIDVLALLTNDAIRDNLTAQQSAIDYLAEQDAAAKANRGASKGAKKAAAAPAAAEGGEGLEEEEIDAVEASKRAAFEKEAVAAAAAAEEAEAAGLKAKLETAMADALIDPSFMDDLKRSTAQTALINRGGVTAAVAVMEKCIGEVDESAAAAAGGSRKASSVANSPMGKGADPESQLGDQKLFLQGMRLIATVFWDSQAASGQAALMERIFKLIPAAFQLFGFQPQLRAPTLYLLYMLVGRTKKGTSIFLKHGGLSIMLQYMSTCETSQLAFIASCISMMLEKDENTSAALLSLKGIDTICALMGRHKKNLAFMRVGCDILSRLTMMDDEISKDVCAKSMHILSGALEEHPEEKEFLNQVRQRACLSQPSQPPAAANHSPAPPHSTFNNSHSPTHPPLSSFLRLQVLKLEQQFALEEENIIVIVQFGGISGIVSMLQSNMDEAPVVSTCIELLGDIFLNSQEYAEVAWEEGCMDELEAVEKRFSDDREIVKAVKSAKLHLSVGSRKKQAEESGAKAKSAAAAKLKQKKAAAAGGGGAGKAARMLKMQSVREDTGMNRAGKESAAPAIGLGSEEGLRMRSQREQSKRAGGAPAPKSNSARGVLGMVESGSNPLAMLKAASQKTMANGDVEGTNPLAGMQKSSTAPAAGGGPNSLAGLMTAPKKEEPKKKKGMFGFGKGKK